MVQNIHFCFHILIADVKYLFFDFIHGLETNWQMVYLDMIHSYLYKSHKTCMLKTLHSHIFIVHMWLI
jgi:hypothetical protein